MIASEAVASADVRRSILPAAAAAALSVSLQVVLPRLFSVLLWYHLGFLAVSLAMVGFATGGILVLRRRLRAPAGHDGLELHRLLGFGSAAALLAVAVAVRIPVDPTALLGGFSDPLLLFLVVAVLAVPFLLLGTVVCAALDRARDRVGSVYAATFAGGAFGALATLVVMDRLGGAPVAIAALSALAALPAAKDPRARGPLLFALTLSLAAAWMPGAVIPLESRKHFPRISPDQVIDEQWNAFSRVTFYDNENRDGLWEMPSSFRGELPRSIGVAIDAWAITSILDVDDSPGSLRFLSAYPPTLAYAGAKPGFRALVIGAGGGVDVLGALHRGAGEVRAVEINPLIVKAVQGRFRDFAHDLYGDPRVSIFVAEGRNFVERDAERYDRIVLSGVDTFAATEAGAFALSENYLYTVEALGEYYEHLNEGGILAMTRWWFQPPRQTLRLVLTAREALARRGVPDIRDRVFLAVTQGGKNSIFLLKRGALADEELAILRAEAAARGCAVVHPTIPPHPVYSRAMDPASYREVIAESAYRVEPTTDDRPFFFENSKLGNAFLGEGDWIHDRLGGVELVLVTLAVLLLLSLPMIGIGVSGLSVSGPGSMRRALPFLFLGLAYMTVEVALLPRLSLVMGHPVYAVSVVLVALLLGSGLGSFAQAKLAPERAGAACAAAALLVVAVLVIAYPDLRQATREAGLLGRAAAVVLYLALPAFVMGMPFPLAIRRLGADEPGLIPAAFLMNGIGSVLAGPIAVLLSIEFGFRATLAAGAALYLAAAIPLAVRGSRRDAAPAAA